MSKRLQSIISKMTDAELLHVVVDCAMLKIDGKLARKAPLAADFTLAVGELAIRGIVRGTIRQQRP